jgi:hypothetical protein
MKAFVVAYVSFHDNNLVMDKVYATSKLDAAHQFLRSQGEFTKAYSELAKLKAAMFDSDALIEVLELNPSDDTSRKLPALLMPKH